MQIEREIECSKAAIESERVETESRWKSARKLKAAVHIEGFPAIES